jgi:hypothetical protein
MSQTLRQTDTPKQETLERNMNATNVVKLRRNTNTSVGQVNGTSLYQAENGLIFSVPAKAVPETTSEGLRAATLETFFERQMRDLERVCAGLQRLP